MSTNIKFIDECKERGYDTLAFSNNGGYVYPVMESDIPQGATDTYAPIDSKEAVEFYNQSVLEGYSYEGYFD